MGSAEAAQQADLAAPASFEVGYHRDSAVTWTYYLTTDGVYKGPKNSPVASKSIRP